MTSNLADGAVEDDLGRRRRRKVRGRSVVRQRSPTPEAKEKKITVTVETNASAKITSVKILRTEMRSVKDTENNEPQVKQEQQVQKKVQNIEGLVDDGWGGLVKETESFFRKGKNDNVNVERNGEPDNAKIVEVLSAQNGSSRGVDTVAYNASEKEKFGDEEIQEVRTRSVVEDRLEKLELLGRSGEPGGYGIPHRRKDFRRRGRGRIVCLDWLKGRCTYGTSCKFLHQEEEEYIPNASRSPERSYRGRRICFDWTKGMCARGDRCRFTHGGERVRGSDICFDFQKGRCNRGDACKFAHEKARQDACFDFRNGRCFRGELCRFSHDVGLNKFVERTRSRGICYDWQKGICRRGYSCRFEHEEESSQNNTYESMKAKRTGLTDFVYESDHMKKRSDMPSVGIEYEDGWCESAHQEDEFAPVSEYNQNKLFEKEVNEYNSNEDGNFL